jgi:iron complex outermembrane receptor protein
MGELEMMACVFALTAIQAMLAKSRRRLAPLYICMISAISSVAAVAGTATDASVTPNAVADTNSGDAVIEEIVVTAQRREQSISQVPISIQAFDSKQLEIAGVQSTLDLVKLSPSISYRTEYSVNSGGFAIRGVSSTTPEGGLQSSAGIIIDGVPAYRAGEFVADLADIERIEILRGPQGTLFGKNSTAGVVNIVGKAPAQKLEASAEVGQTNDHETWVRGMVNAPVTDSVALRFNTFYRDQRPLLENPGGGSDELGSRAYGFQAKLGADFASNVHGVLTASYSHHSDTNEQPFIVIPNSGPLGVFQEIVAGTTFGYGNTHIDSDGLSKEKFDSTAFIGEVNWNVSDRLTLTSLTGHRRFAADTTIDAVAMPDGFVQGKGFSPNPLHYPIMNGAGDYPYLPETNAYSSQEFRLHYSDARMDIVSGIFAQTVTSFGSVESKYFLDPTANPDLAFLNGAIIVALWTSNQFKFQDNTYAAFGDTTFKFTDSVSAFGGVRYTREYIDERYSRDDRTGLFAGQFDPLTGAPLTPAASTTAFTANDAIGNWSGRVGMQWRPTDVQNYYASVNRGYKGPAVNVGRLADPTIAPVITKPELATAFEIGTKQRLLNGRLIGSLAIYDQKIANIQQTVLLPSSTLGVLANAGDLVSKGLEFETQLAVTRELRLGASYAYTDATYENAGNASCYTGQTAALGCVAGRQNISGKPAVVSPKSKYNLSLVETHPLSVVPASVVFSADWTWNSKIQYSVNEDPLTVDKSHGFLNASLGLVSEDGHWQATLFGKNLTNEFYYGTLEAGDGFLGRVFGWIGRDYTRYGGLTVKYRY